MISADVVLAALAEIETVLADRHNMSSLRISIARRRVAELQHLIEQQRTQVTS